MTTEKWAIAPSDDKVFYGEYDNREAAIKAGVIEFSGKPFCVGELRQPAPLSKGVDAHYMVEQAVEATEEDYCLGIPVTDGWPNATPEQYKDLQTRIGAVLDAWVKDHGLTPQWFVVGNIQRIEPTHLSD